MRLTVGIKLRVESLFKSKEKINASFSLPRDMYDTLGLLAEAKGLSISEIIRDLLDQLLEHEIKEGTIKHAKDVKRPPKK